jgi:hypothetical protein
MVRKRKIIVYIATSADGGVLRGNPICRLSGLQYTLPGCSQHRRIYTPPWINA